MRAFAVALLLAAFAGGCGRDGDRDAVRSVTERFYAALDAGDGDAACARLSTDTRTALESEEQQACAEAVGSLEVEGGDLTRIQVYVTNAKADLSSGESASSPTPRTAGASPPSAANRWATSRPTSRTTASWRPDVRAVFVLYLVVIGAGLTYGFIIGLLQLMRRFVQDNGLGLFFGALFLATLVAEAFVGHADFNHGQLAHHGDPISLGRYVTSSDFVSDVFENWQSEYLQFTLFILATVWLIAARIAGVEGAGQAGRRVGRGPEDRSVCRQTLAPMGPRRRASHMAVLELAGHRHGLDLDRLVDRAGDRRAGRLQRRAARPPGGRADVRAVRRHVGLLEPHAPELAVRAPRRRLDGRAGDLPPPARLTGVQARGRPYASTGVEG